MWNELSTASKILRARLAHINRVDVHVLDREIVEAPQDLNQIPSRMFCYPSKRKSGLPFLLVFGREDPDKDISHIFCFYVNSRFRIIQKTERRLFETRLKKGTRLGLDVKLGVVNIEVDVPEPLYFSILIQMGEFLLDLDLINNFTLEKRINNCAFSSMVCFNPTIPFPGCRIMEIDSDSRRVWDRIYDQRITICEFNFDRPPTRLHKNFDVLKIYYQDHIIYGIRYKFYDILMLLLTHPSMFQCEEDAQDVTTVVSEVISSSNIRLNHVGATRFFGEVGHVCNSDSVLKSILLSLNLPLVTIKQCDVDFVFLDEDVESIVEGVLSAHCSQEPGPSVPYPPNWSDDEEILPNLEDHGEPELDPVTVSLNIDASSCEPIVVGVPQPMDTDDSLCEPAIATSSQVLSQSTVILSQRYIDDQIAERRRALNIKEELKQEHPAIDIMPFDDPRNKILTNVPFFKRQLTHIVDNYGLPATLLNPIALPDLIALLEETLPESKRMIIVPLQTPVRLVLLVFDKEAKEWGLINPNIASQRDMKVFARLKSHMTEGSHCFTDYEGRQIDIPCHFHTRYRLMHLLLAVYRLCQAYGQAKMLPMWIPYTEKRLRLFCHKVCKALQEANQAYNLRQGLVRENNYLKPGAYRSLPSNLSFEQSVVAVDGCLFCGKRGFKNLGSHISMAHDEQAHLKRERRRWMDNRRSS